MTKTASWVTLLAGAAAAFGTTFVSSGNLIAAGAAAAAWIIAHLLPSPVASVKPAA